MPKVYAGTSGWAYSSWKPDFYPAKLPSAKFLNYYGTRLNSVEVNYTFRSFPTDRLLKGWMDATPAGFKFALKAHQMITHVKRLRGAAEFTAEFVSSLQPLKDAGKLGPVLFQLPPYLKCDVPLLTDFLAGLPRHLRAAFEFRDTSWFDDEVFAALRKRNAALCYAESETIQAPPVQTAEFFYFRLRKDNYSAKNLREQTQRIVDLGRQGEVFAYFKHEETPKGASRAEALLAATNAGSESPCARTHRPRLHT
jgi:uncharacterized protein YecE (DUF72 family)